jgi:hypothetical protein
MAVPLCPPPDDAAVIALTGDQRLFPYDRLSGWTIALLDERLHRANADGNGAFAGV